MELKKVLGAATGVMAVLCVISTQIKTTSVNVDESEYYLAGNVGHIEEGETIIYDYKSSGGVVDAYQLYFATYGEELEKGRVLLEVHDADTGELIGGGEVDAEDIYDNTSTLVYTDEMNLKKGDVRLVIYTEDFDSDGQVTLWQGDTDDDRDARTMVNGIVLKDNLLVFERKVTKETPYTWDCVLIMSICFVIFCIVPDNKGGQSEDVQEETD